MLNLPDPSAPEEGDTEVQKVMKMAHSGEFVTIRSVLATGLVPPPALRLYLLSQRYRINFTYSLDSLLATVKRWRQWAETRATVLRIIGWAEEHTPTTSEADTRAVRELEAALASGREEFVTAMDDDFNTSGALAAIDGLTSRINTFAATFGGNGASAVQLGALRQAMETLDELSGVLGVSLEAPAMDNQLDAGRKTAIEALVAQRDEARAAKHWAEADRIREELDERYGVVIKDTPQGATWSLKGS
jgi:cysteinyl-tRNA synthetase